MKKLRFGNFFKTLDVAVLWTKKGQIARKRLYHPQVAGYAICNGSSSFKDITTMVIIFVPFSIKIKLSSNPVDCPFLQTVLNNFQQLIGFVLTFSSNMELNISLSIFLN